MPALETVAPFHEVRIHPRTGAVVPINIGWLSPLLSTDEDWYDPEELTVAVHANFDGKYGVRLSAVPRNGSVVVLDMSNPSSPVELTQTTSTPGTGEFWVAEQAAQSDYGQVNLGFGFVEVHSSLNGVLLEVHYQSVGSVLSNDVINDKIETEVTSQLVASTPYPPGHIYGLTMANNGSDPTNDIDIAAGSARDSTNAENIILASALTKRLDAAWAVGTGNGGLDTGAIADTTYHIWLIKRSDTGVVDALFSASATSPTMPANYDYKRLIGSLRRISGSLQVFTQVGDTFILTTPTLDIDTNNPGTSAILATLPCPGGINVTAIINYVQIGDMIAYVSSPDQTDSVPSSSAAPLFSVRGEASGYGNSGVLYIRTNTSSQIRYRLDASNASTYTRISLLGWVNTRGR